MQRTHFSEGQSHYGIRSLHTEAVFRDTRMTGFSGAYHMVYDELTAEQLKERLMVAETIMKRLYNRNKELESYHSDQAHGEGPS